MEFVTGGELLKQIRKRLGVSQQELGMGKINHNTISRIEGNKEAISYMLAMRLSENINSISQNKGIQLSVNAKELLETEQDKCERWCKKELKKITESENTEQNVSRCDEIISLMQKYNLVNMIVQARELSAELLYKLSRYQDAFSRYMKCIEFYEKSNDLLKLVEINNKLGMCLYTRDLDESFKYHYKAYELLEGVDKTKDYHKLKIEVIYFIALYYARKEDFGSAREYLDKIVNLYPNEDDLKIRILILEGNVLLRQNEHKKALEILEGLVKLDKNLIAPYEYMIYNNMGVCLNYLGEYEKSIGCLTKAINLQMDKNLPNLTNSLIHTGKVHIKLLQDDIAVKFLEAALTNATKYEQAKYVFECNELLYSIYRRKNQLKECNLLIEKCRQVLDDYGLEKDYSYRYCILKTDYLIQNNDLTSAKALLDKIINGKEIHK